MIKPPLESLQSDHHGESTIPDCDDYDDDPTHLGPQGEDSDDTTDSAPSK